MSQYLASAFPKCSKSSDNYYDDYVKPRTFNTIVECMEFFRNQIHNLTDYRYFILDMQSLESTEYVIKQVTSFEFVPRVVSENTPTKTNLRDIVNKLRVKSK